MTLEDSIHASRVRVLREAERTGNVSATCRRHGVSRTVFYRLRRRFEQYGADGVHPKRRRAAVGRPSASRCRRNGASSRSRWRGQPVAPSG
jgi:transposase-like protein